MSSTTYLALADVVLSLHVLFVLFVIGGLVAIFLGRRRWRWVRNWWFRATHLTGIAVVVAQSWFGLVCPLTRWEMQLREMGDGAVYAGSFISHWLNALLYYEAPAWVFVAAYTIFGAAVLASWFFVRPMPRSRPAADAG